MQLKKVNHLKEVHVQAPLQRSLDLSLDKTVIHLLGWGLFRHKLIVRRPFEVLEVVKGELLQLNIAGLGSFLDSPYKLATLSKQGGSLIVLEHWTDKFESFDDSC